MAKSKQQLDLDDSCNIDTAQEDGQSTSREPRSPGIDIHLLKDNEVPKHKRLQEGEEILQSFQIDLRSFLTLETLLHIIQSEDDDEYAGQLHEEINKFIAGVRRYYRNILRQNLEQDTENIYRKLITDWNRYLHRREGGHYRSPIISVDIQNRISEFISFWENAGEQINEGNKKAFRQWLSRWNMFLEAQKDKSRMSKFSVFLTAMGLVFFVADMMSDVGTAILYGYKQQWYKCAMTLLFVYLAASVSTVRKYFDGRIDKLRCVSSLIINWTDLQECWTFLQCEWKLFKYPQEYAYLVPEWQARMYNVSWMKFNEGLWEACPQAILQLCFLISEINSDITWIGSMRIASTMISLCTAGAALVNKEKFERIVSNTELLVSELVVLHIWAVPMTVSRLLSISLLLTVHLYVGLGCIILHMLLYGVYWCTINKPPRFWEIIFATFLLTVQLFISPFDDDDIIPSLLVRHFIHFLGNLSATLVWALNTPMQCTHPALYIAIITVNWISFVIGILVGFLHKKYWHR